MSILNINKYTDFHIFFLFISHNIIILKLTTHFKFLNNLELDIGTKTY